MEFKKGMFFFFFSKFSIHLWKNFLKTEKKKIIEKGFPSKAKMAAGGIALRGLGRAFMKGGKV